MPATDNLTGYYNRFDPNKQYDQHLVIAGRGTQSAEINEIQANLQNRLQGVANVFLKDGDVIRDGQAVVDPNTGVTQMESGALYVRGAVRGVQPRSFTIPIDRVVTIGVHLVERVITALEDPELRDPAVGTRNYGEEGAERLQIVPVWGWDGDGEEGEFFGVYDVEFGRLLSKEPPPNLDSVTQALAKYDRDSAGGNYIISGLSVSCEYDRVNEKLVLLIGEGRARVNGYPVEIPSGLRFTYDADPDIKSVVDEPKTFTPDGSGKMRVNLDNAPVRSVGQIRITAQKTVTITHGAFIGAKDALPDNSVLAIIQVKQGATIYNNPADYKLTAGEVDWSPGGAEPAPGSTYDVTYQYRTTTAAVVTDVDDRGFTITGPVSGSLFTIDYSFALPRIDAVVLDQQGRVARLSGVASQYAPAAPGVPDTQLRIAGLVHDWFGNPSVIRDAVVVMPMDELQGMRNLVYDLFDLVAQNNLRTDIAMTDPSAKRGVFVDPFNNDNLRDAGIVQNLAVVGGELMLPVAADVHNIGAGIVKPALLPFVYEVIIEQPYRTDTMKINPYQAFTPPPAQMTVSPPVDFWQVTQSIYTSAETRQFLVIDPSTHKGFLTQWLVGQSDEVTGSTTSEIPYLRQIELRFTVNGFGPGEILQSLTFDGIAVTPEAA